MITLEKNMDTVKIFNQKTVKAEKAECCTINSKTLAKKTKVLMLNTSRRRITCFLFEALQLKIYA